MSATGGGPRNTKHNTNDSDKYKNFHKNLRVLSKEKLLPCIVFAFSKVKCEEFAQSIYEYMDYTTGKEKGEIKKFLKQKLQRLQEHDRDLPQINMIKDLVVKGIGVHHAGLLPIVKEMVEILF